MIDKILNRLLAEIEQLKNQMRISYDTINEVVTRHNKAEIDIKDIDERLRHLEEFDLRKIDKRICSLEKRVSEIERELT